jgi:hypothetical protein
MDIADDSKMMRGIVQRAIRQVAFRGLTSEAENGAQGLEKLRCRTAQAYSFRLAQA